MTLDFIKVIAPAAVSFIVGILVTPVISHYLYKYKLWKKDMRQVSVDGRDAPVYRRLHANRETGTPLLGGIIVWGSAVITVLLFWLMAQLNGALANKLNFLSRNQTWLPLFTLVAGALVGLFDDWFTISKRTEKSVGGISIQRRLLIVLLVTLAGAWWFFFKLEVSTIIVPFMSEWNIGLFFIPFFILVMLGTYSGGIIDGIDGLAAGVLAIIFSAYGTIAFFQQQIDLAAFSFVIVGALLAFLWFNIPPARFYLGETGIMSITLTLAVIAFLTRQVLILPIIAFPLVASSLSSIIQLASKKIRGKKVFIAAPLHHHLEARGWPPHKVVMRYWVLTAMFSVIGILIAFLGS